MKRISGLLLLVVIFFATNVAGQVPLRITEADGAPSKTNASKLVFPNGTVTISGGVATVSFAAFGGDASTNTGTSVDSELVLFSGTTGKLVKRATTTGLLVGVSGVLEAGITSSTVGQALRVTGANTFAFGALDLADTDAITGDLPFTNLTGASAASKLLGRGSAAGAGDYQEITIGANLTMTGATLSASAVPLWRPVAGCDDLIASNLWDIFTSNKPTPACVTGTNTTKGVLDFPDSDGDFTAQITEIVPTIFTGIDVNFRWFSAATTGNIVWQFQASCTAAGETDDPAWNTASTVTDTANGTTLQVNEAAITGVTVTGCAAGELLHLRLLRNRTHASDTIAGTIRLIGVDITLR